ncbi:MAG TPA: hypothetical protein VFV86_05255 [Nitrososphaeraceae archaeon]|nr:hypothetical protein [Nitrososphaeraceae archaeon]
MTAMVAIHVIFIRDFISEDLEINKSAATFVEKMIKSIPSDDIIIDFSNVKSITPEFVHQYLTIKRKIKKQIHEVNLPSQVESIINKAQKSIKK